MMARIAVAGLCLLTLGGYSSCVFISTDDNDENDPDEWQNIGHDDFVTTLILRDSTGTASTSFVMGESIRFDLEIQNTSGHVSTLTLPTTQIYDFYVLDAATSNVRWHWSDNMGFAPAATPLSFTPNATRAYSVVWNGVLSNGAQLPAGTYRARGVIVATDFRDDPLTSSPLGSNIVNFTVR